MDCDLPTLPLRSTDQSELTYWPPLMKTIMYLSPKDRAAKKAVVMLLAHSTAAWSSSTPPLDTAPKQIAATAARNPTTVAWTCRTECCSIHTEPLVLLCSPPEQWRFNAVRGASPEWEPGCCAPSSTASPGRPSDRCLPENTHESNESEGFSMLDWSQRFGFLILDKNDFFFFNFYSKILYFFVKK